MKLPEKLNKVMAQEEKLLAQSNEVDTIIIYAGDVMLEGMRAPANVVLVSWKDEGKGLALTDVVSIGMMDWAVENLPKGWNTAFSVEIQRCKAVMDQNLKTLLKVAFREAEDNGLIFDEYTKWLNEGTDNEQYILILSDSDLGQIEEALGKENIIVKRIGSYTA